MRALILALTLPLAECFALPQSLSRRAVLTTAAALSAPPGAALAASTPNDKRDPAVVATVVALDAAAGADRNKGEMSSHVPRLAIKTNDMLAVAKVIQTVPPISTADDYVEYMWIRETASGTVLAAKEFTAAVGSADGILATGNGQGGESAACSGYDALAFKCAPTSSLVASIDKGKRVVAVVKYHVDGLWETPPLEVK